MNLVDRDGKQPGDYYDENGFYMGSDNIDDGKHYILTSPSNNNQGEIIMISVPLPSENQLATAQAAIDFGLESGCEAGFVMGDGTASKLKKSNNGGTVNLSEGFEELNGSTTSEAHYHPFDLIDKGNDSYVTFDTTPSPDDKFWRESREKSGLYSPTSPSWIMGEEIVGNVTRDNDGKLVCKTQTSVRFYTSNGYSNPIEWKKFNNTVNTIRKNK